MVIVKDGVELAQKEAGKNYRRALRDSSKFLRGMMTAMGVASQDLEPATGLWISQKGNLVILFKSDKEARDFVERWGNKFWRRWRRPMFVCHPPEYYTNRKARHSISELAQEVNADLAKEKEAEAKAKADREAKAKAKAERQAQQEKERQEKEAAAAAALVAQQEKERQEQEAADADNLMAQEEWERQEWDATQAPAELEKNRNMEVIPNTRGTIRRRGPTKAQKQQFRALGLETSDDDTSDSDSGDARASKRKQA
jgi:flagellar biosynthesis GTPase FlhF